MSAGTVSTWRLAGLSRATELARARSACAQDERALRGQLASDAARLHTAMTQRAGHPHVVLGTTSGGTRYVLPVADFHGLFGQITASTGSGKSYLAGQVLADLLVFAVFTGLAAVIVFDMKGELADLTLRWIGGYLARLSWSARQAVFSRLLVLRFFKGAYLPEWNLLARDPAVPILTQAHAFAETMEAALGTELGIRQSPATTALTALGVETARSTLALRYLLHDPDTCAHLAEQSGIPDVRLYVHTRLERERTALDGVAARLDALLRVEPIKAALAGPGILDLRRCYIPGTITILDLGGAPLGAESQKRALAALTLTRLTWAGFDAPERPPGAFTMIIADELQEALVPATVRHVERVVTTGRSSHLGLLSIHQSVEQLPAELRAILSTNVRLRVLGRSGEADARLSAEWLPHTGLLPNPRLPGMPAPAHPEFLSEAQELRHRIAELGKLPRQTFLVADRAAAFGPCVLRAPDFHPPTWDELDSEIAEAVQRGAVGQPRAELVRRAREIEEQAASALLTSLRTRPPSSRRRTMSATPTLPDVVTPATRRRGGGGEVP